jgi:hypothetical protein
VGRDSFAVADKSGRCDADHRRGRKTQKESDSSDSRNGLHVKMSAEIRGIDPAAMYRKITHEARQNGRKQHAAGKNRNVEKDHEIS